MLYGREVVRQPGNDLGVVRAVFGVVCPAPNTPCLIRDKITRPGSIDSPTYGTPWSWLEGIGGGGLDGESPMSRVEF